MNQRPDFRSLFRQLKRQVDIDTRNRIPVSNSRSLDEIGLSNLIDQSSTGHDYLNSYEKELSHLRDKTCEIVIISNKDPIATADTFAEFFKNAQINLFYVGNSAPRDQSRFPNVIITHTADIENIHQELSTLRNLEVIIDDGTNLKSSKVQYFTELFLHLKPEGIYVAEDLHASHIAFFNDTNGEDIDSLLSRLMSFKNCTDEMRNKYNHEERVLSQAIRRLSHYGKIVFVEKQGHHLYKLADGVATRLLDKSYGKKWGAVLEEISGGSFQSRSNIQLNNSEHKDLFPKNIEYPTVSSREYFDVTCAPGQIAVTNDFALPDSFRLFYRGNLSHRRLVNAGTHFAIDTHELRNPKQFLKGQYFYLDREWSAYGHVPTEVISRLWAWDKAKLRYPKLKVLVSAPDTKNMLPSWERTLLMAYGISGDDIVVIDQPTRIETLIAATPMFGISDFVHPRISAIWSRIRNELMDTGYESTDKVFLSRSKGALRECRNSEELESMFRELGYTVLRPELLPLGQQIALLANARSVAGYAGSALLNLVFAGDEKNIIVIGTDSFMNANEYLISSVLGGQFVYNFSTADIQQPPRGWSQSAYHSSFSFDFTRDGEFLREAVQSLDPTA